MSIKLLAGIAGAALFSTAASAQFTGTATSPFDIADTATAAPRGDATGDLVETGLTVFNTNNGAFFDTPIFHSIGSTETFATAMNVEVTSSIVDNGNGTRTMNISWTTNDGTALFGPDAFGDGEGVTTLGFEMGVNNVPNDFVEDPDYAGIADPDDGMGTFLSSFTLLDAAGATLFSGTFFVTDFGTGFGGIVNIGAGGADLGTFNIGGGSASITYNVIPAPGAAALFGLGGLAAARRRR